MSLPVPSASTNVSAVSLSGTHDSHNQHSASRNGSKRPSRRVSTCKSTSSLTKEKERKHGKDWHRPGSLAHDVLPELVIPVEPVDPYEDLRYVEHDKHDPPEPPLWTTRHVQVMKLLPKQPVSPKPALPSLNLMLPIKREILPVYQPQITYIRCVEVLPREPTRQRSVSRSSPALVDILLEGRSSRSLSGRRQDKTSAPAPQQAPDKNKSAMVSHNGDRNEPPSVSPHQDTTESLPGLHILSRETGIGNFSKRITVSQSKIFVVFQKHTDKPRHKRQKYLPGLNRREIKVCQSRTLKHDKGSRQTLVESLLKLDNSRAGT
ncbi:hypothetical protein BaRGS_00024794 [Batillaria attramentaria]|uniref:Uncharacterized protein n=1 Tax=Batillaria attramentaria TaxID=370345 RepID=A0ABD0K9W1_9CAEN